MPAGPQCAVRNTPSARVATQALSKDELLAQLGLVDTGRSGNPELTRSGFCVSDNGDWRIVACADPDWGTEAPLMLIAQAGPALAGGYTDRTDMFAELRAAEGDVVSWSVRYEAADNDQLSLTGAVPPAVDATIGAVLTAPRDDIDDDDDEADAEAWARCEAVLKAWRTLIGYEPGEENELIWTSADVVRSSPARAGRGFWSRFFAG